LDRDKDVTKIGPMTREKRDKGKESIKGETENTLDFLGTSTGRGNTQVGDVEAEPKKPRHATIEQRSGIARTRHGGTTTMESARTQSCL